MIEWLQVMAAYKPSAHEMSGSGQVTKHDEQHLLAVVSVVDEAGRGAGQIWKLIIPNRLGTMWEGSWVWQGSLKGVSER